MFLLYVQRELKRVQCTMNDVKGYSRHAPIRVPVRTALLRYSVSWLWWSVTSFDPSLFVPDFVSLKEVCALWNEEEEIENPATCQELNLSLANYAGIISAIIREYLPAQEHILLIFNHNSIYCSSG